MEKSTLVRSLVEIPALLVASLFFPWFFPLVEKEQAFLLSAKEIRQSHKPQSQMYLHKLFIAYSDRLEGSV